MIIKIFRKLKISFDAIASIWDIFFGGNTSACAEKTGRHSLTFQNEKAATNVTTIPFIKLN
ncbi:putative secreted protein [Corynebacterium diphtheriae BH8]|nr:putative secreted protein [Corynebacterium diphtheriae 31A]AEX49728.1 putative secreted protein [Corynebacterium diphtheriae BH8]TBX16119.1 hypothetical protein BUW94_08675 [Corynebacterium diphtheriae]